MKISPTAKYGTFDTRQNGQTETVSAPVSTALVPVGRAEVHTSSHRYVSTRPNAPFVAHLIATAEQAPQTRTLRRATSADALAAYGRVTARTAAIVSNDENRSLVA
ncbi:hypothetical protein [Bradyrhizobium sp. SYSU BS000235]|uniref:hypothetical protein n=1 Tax=Bradyrhizobium sp. SYSU BS000235 TaxID=3411332 RepID=UPI003C71D6A4